MVCDIAHGQREIMQFEQPHYSDGSPKYSPRMKCILFTRHRTKEPWHAELTRVKRWKSREAVFFFFFFCFGWPAIIWACGTTSMCVRACACVRAWLSARVPVPLWCVSSPLAVTHESGGSSNSGRSCPWCWNQTPGAPHSDAQLTDDPLRKLNAKVRPGCLSKPET